jgi:hypothetical protein
MFENLLNEPKTSPLVQAFAGFALDRDLPRANAQLEAAWTAALGDQKSLTPPVADEQFKWQMRTWMRIYYLYGPGETAVAHRLSEHNTTQLESLLWNYAAAKSHVTRADLKNIWFIQGSENHDLMDLGNAFLATQALANLPAYADRQLPDGLTPADHAAAWAVYFNAYCKERFRNGLIIEFASPIYGKYFVPELVNIADFADEPTLRHNAKALLDLLWADWAVEQLNGIRGGAKARCYQGKYSRFGARDSWYFMGNILLQQGNWSDAGIYGHPITGFGPVLATSKYRLPEVVKALATQPEARGSYAYVSRRPGRMTNIDPLPPYDDHSCWYHMSRDSRLLRYTWCTPDYVMGSYTIDPALRVDFNMHPNEPERADKHYAAITAQNMWQGIVFDTGPDARIFPQCLGHLDEKNPDISTVYLQHVTVQHENVMLVQANRNNPGIQATRILFGPGMKARLVERDGWWILEEGDSYAAVRIVDRNDPAIAGAASWDTEIALRAEDTHAPLVFVTGRKADCATLEDFVGVLSKHLWDIADGWFTYRFSDSQGEASTLGLSVEKAQVPRKNGAPVVLTPDRYYDNPFFGVSENRETITIAFAGDSYTIDLKN